MTERETITATIRAAFAGVRLGSGRSLRQCAAAGADADMTRAEWERLPASEITDDWTRAPDAEVRHAVIACLDREGLRYYLPALMLMLLDNYDLCRNWETEEGLLDESAGWLDDDELDLALIGTLMTITPGKDSRADAYPILDTFSPEQREAIAAYVEALPRLVHLQRIDSVRRQRSIRDYWGRYLPAGLAAG